MKKSPFAPQHIAEPPLTRGVRLAACEAGIKYEGRKDLMLALFEPGTVVAGVLTRSKTCSSAVDWCRKRLGHGQARALVVNSGNANAFTGMKGAKAVEETALRAAQAARCKPEEIMIASTGVIGEALDPGSFTHHLERLAQEARPENWLDAARAIMTTDTYPKLTSRQIEIDGENIIINGFAKGSGMIAPDMATMLAFVFTDAPISQPLLQELCSSHVQGSFNSISVDSDTSTSDTMLVFATGKAPITPLTANDGRTTLFSEALKDIMRDLAIQIIKDGEGISKLLRVEVEGAENDRAARRIAMAIANSPLVKTALAGEDPNWGRVVMAVGKAGEMADRDRLGIWFGDLEVARNGEVAPKYSEELGAAYMKNDEILIKTVLNIGKGRALVWGCDLTHDYISINADYRS